MVIAFFKITTTCRLEENMHDVIHQLRFLIFILNILKKCVILIVILLQRGISMKKSKFRDMLDSISTSDIMMIILIVLICTILIVAPFSACSQADRVSYNLSKQADSFNVVRKLTVIDCIQGDVLFQMTGKMSINADRTDNQLEITVEDENGTYKKHFVGLSDNVTYVIEDVSVNDVDNYKYTVNFNPKMWLPFDVETID